MSLTDQDVCDLLNVQPEQVAAGRRLLHSCRRHMIVAVQAGRMPLADAIRELDSQAAFTLPVALARLENCIFAQLNTWPAEAKPAAANRLVQIAREIRA